jgi:hypothetical protein
VRVDHVETLIDLFVKKKKRERLRALAGKAGRRADLRHDLLHDRRSLDPAVLLALPDTDGAAVIAYRRLVANLCDTSRSVGPPPAKMDR